MFKVNNKDTKTTSLTYTLYLYFYLFFGTLKIFRYLIPTL